MAPRRKKKKQYKAPDLVDYQGMGFNPFVNDQDTIDKLNDEYDPATVDIRRRKNKWLDRERERAKLAEKLGVEQKVKLTPATEILDEIKHLTDPE